jgi:hypothetical protein
VREDEARCSPDQWVDAQPWSITTEELPHPPATTAPIPTLGHPQLFRSWFRAQVKSRESGTLSPIEPRTSMEYLRKPLDRLWQL